MRTVFASGDFAANRIAIEPPAVTNLDAWQYLRNSAAGSPNLVDATPPTVLGSPVWDDNYVTVTPDVNYLEPVGITDAANCTYMFVARTQQVGGNFSPIVSAYPGASSGFIIALGWNYVRVHATGMGAIGSYVMPATYGLSWAFYSVIMENGASQPIRIKNWTAGVSGNLGTAASSRVSFGGQVRVNGYTSTLGTFSADVALWGRARSIMTPEQIEGYYESAKGQLAPSGMSI